MFNPDTPVAACQAVVIDPAHQRFGQVAAIRYHDWQEYGVLGLTFPCGETGEFRDGLLSDDLELPQATVFHRKDAADILRLQANLPQIRPTLAAFTAVVGTEDLPREFRQSAKSAFWEGIRKATGEQRAAA